MDIAAFRRRVLEIQAELGALDPKAPGAAERATTLSSELEELAAEQRQRSAKVAARAFGQAVTPTALDAPVDTFDRIVERVEATATPGEPGARRPKAPE